MLPFQRFAGRAAINCGNNNIGGGAYGGAPCCTLILIIPSSKRSVTFTDKYIFFRPMSWNTTRSVLAVPRIGGGNDSGNGHIERLCSRLLQ